ncbi:MAG: DUF2891 family protein, partial [Chitinivibrionia bacterium]|nr:DUF2891 family protein [Chitinivibrionia bacterium]
MLAGCLAGCPGKQEGGPPEEKNTAASPSSPASPPRLQTTAEVAAGFSRLALRCIQKEYPNKLDHVMNDSAEVREPRDLHPAFYGCFDWHSSVHGHWMLVR